MSSSVSLNSVDYATNKESNFTDPQHTDYFMAKPKSYKETNALLADLAVKYGVNQRWLTLKQDLIIIPPICLLYLLAFLDRVNVSNAKVYGMEADIGMDPNSNQWNIALCIFFVPYIVFEIPSNFFLKKFKPSIWLSFCMVCFGVCCMCIGFIHTYGQFLALRFLLGLFEAGMFPGCFYLLSCWFRREEAQKRYSFFFSSTSLAGAFGGLIAYGMHTIDGKRGYEDWRWLFIVEGAITAFVALCMVFIISDFPEQAKFLSENERQFVKEKLALDQGDSAFDQKVEIKDMISVFKDWKVWAAGMMYFGCLVPSYGYAYFATSIIKTFKYSDIKTQVYSIFPWICTFGSGMIFAFFSDLFRHRYLFTVLGGFCSIAGFGILLGTEIEDVHARYAACFLICLGMYGTMPIIVCWSNMNFSGHYRKMVASAWQVGFGNIGGIIATWLYVAKDAPKYTKANGVALAFVCLSMISCLAYFLGLRYENKKKGTAQAQEAFDALPHEKKILAGDLNPMFIYQY